MNNTKIDKIFIVLELTGGIVVILLSILDIIVYKENAIGLFVDGFCMIGIGIIDNINRKNNIYDSRLSKLSTLFAISVMSLTLINILIFLIK